MLEASSTLSFTLFKKNIKYSVTLFMECREIYPTVEGKKKKSTQFWVEVDDGLFFRTCGYKNVLRRASDKTGPVNFALSG